MFNLPSGNPQKQRPAWIRPVLLAAAVYNILWGIAVIVAPSAAFTWSGIEPPRYPEIWQCVGMIVGVYGVGYWIAAGDAFRHWPIVLVGLLGKVLGPIGFLMTALGGGLPWSWGVTLIFNDLIWWIPFAAILYYAVKFNADTSIGNAHDLDDSTIIFPSQRGRTLAELSQQRPVMLVFLRHFGCTFCREALADLSQARRQIEELGFDIALVHMSQPQEADAMLKQYGMTDVHHFSDGHCEIYRAFGLQRGTIVQLLGLTVWWRGASASMRGHMAGRLAGDSFRLPGLFFIHHGNICGSYRHRTAADRPDYVALARECQTAIAGDVAVS